MKHITTHSAEQTMDIARHIGARLRGGECIELISDVGGGKTTFTRGLAKGAGSDDHVSSPTFTISKQYRADRFRIVHFDFYRIHEAGDIAHELDETVDDESTVIVVEWSDVVSHVLPSDRLKVTIASSGEDQRILTLSYPISLEYLVDTITP